MENELNQQELLAKIPDGSIIFGKLIKFGDTLLNPDDVQAIDFSQDGKVNCEIGLRHSESTWQLGPADSLGLAKIIYRDFNKTL